MSRLRTVLLVPDCHHPYADMDGWELMLDVARDIKPEVIVCIGDFADFYAVSFHSKDPGRRLHFREEIEFVRRRREELDALGAAEKEFTEGNHCYRFTRYLMDRAPEMFGIVDTDKLLELSENGWKFTPYRRHTQRGKLHYTHDTGSSGKYAVYRNLDTYGHSVVAGHTHRLAYIVEGNAKGDVRLSASFGWLGDIEQVDYMNRQKAARAWALGFGVGYEDKQTGHTFWVPVPIVDKRCVVAGKLYRAPRLRKKK